MFLKCSSNVPRTFLSAGRGALAVAVAAAQRDVAPFLRQRGRHGVGDHPPEQPGRDCGRHGRRGGRGHVRVHPGHLHGDGALHVRVDERVSAAEVRRQPRQQPHGGVLCDWRQRGVPGVGGEPHAAGLRRGHDGLQLRDDLGHLPAHPQRPLRNQEGLDPYGVKHQNARDDQNRLLGWRERWRFEKGNVALGAKCRALVVFPVARVEENRRG
eukprot:1196338-Prorocentrum_minimum.AAC.6